MARDDECWSKHH
jgi:hypothetical protein